ncbi:MAG: methyl-accepting chemotaxis protein [Oscillatoriales cyanobacterium SM2_2_1]|nr:methyl-accepting chemotaxis protein [Oscillatoriales cyanobacterium SM2_2_1]
MPLFVMMDEFALLPKLLFSVGSGSAMAVLTFLLLWIVPEDWRSVTAIAGLILTLSGTGAGVLVVLRVVRSLLLVDTLAKHYARGELSQGLEIRSRDEIGSLSHSLARIAEVIDRDRQERESVTRQGSRLQEDLQESLIQIQEALADIKVGDLTVQADPYGQLTDGITTTINLMVQQFSSTVANLSQQLQQLGSIGDSMGHLLRELDDVQKKQQKNIIEAQTESETVQNVLQTLEVQTESTERTLPLIRQAIRTGQSELGQLGRTIAQLEQGAAQIGQRIRNLDEFVNIAKQFVQDQKRLASLTQVLAMNASMVAARAVEQREPDQFSSVAREFEAIAAQVNSLARQTNQGLILLQQRTGSLEVVVSGIAQDIEEVSSSVGKFSGSIQQSQESFTMMKDYTDRLAQVSSKLNTCAYDLTQALDQNAEFNARLEVSQTQTQDQIRALRQQIDTLDRTARRSQDILQFFRLPDRQRAPLNGTLPS